MLRGGRQARHNHIVQETLLIFGLFFFHFCGNVFTKVPFNKQTTTTIRFNYSQLGSMKDTCSRLPPAGKIGDLFKVK